MVKKSFKSGKSVKACSVSGCSTSHGQSALLCILLLLVVFVIFGNI